MLLQQTNHIIRSGPNGT